MKSLSVILILGLLASQANAGTLALECPKGLEGKWACKAEGMPGDGAETSFHLEIKASHVGELITFYDFSDDRYPLDGKMRLVPSLSRGPHSGSEVDWYRASTCGDGKLLSEYVSVDAHGNWDWKNSRVETIQMRDDNSFTIQEPLSSDTDICTRVN